MAFVGNTAVHVYVRLHMSSYIYRFVSVRCPCWRVVAVQTQSVRAPFILNDRTLYSVNERRSTW